MISLDKSKHLSYPSAGQSMEPEYKDVHFVQFIWHVWTIHKTVTK